MALAVLGGPLQVHTNAVPALLPTQGPAAVRLERLATTPDPGGFPSAIILGAGKCGTNALAAALEQLGFSTPKNHYTHHQEKERMGFLGEINWPCARWSQDKDLAAYKKHFPKDGSRWIDKSTSYLQCASNISAIVPPSTKIFAMLCDPLQAVWSRMNHEIAHGSGINESTLLHTVRVRLSALEGDCSTLAARDAGFSRALCHQLDEGLNYGKNVRSWRERTPVRFLLKEKSRSDPLYVLREAAAHVGVPVPPNATLGSVHSNAADESYLLPEGDAWQLYFELAEPALRPVVRGLDDGTLDGGQGQSLSELWLRREIDAGFVVSGAYD